jgi:hypothetical protein
MTDNPDLIGPNTPRDHLALEDDNFDVLQPRKIA